MDATPVAQYVPVNTGTLSDAGHDNNTHDGKSEQNT